MTEGNGSGSGLDRKTMESLDSLADWSRYDLPVVWSSPWEDDGDTTLSSLLAVADRGKYGVAKKGVPWESGHKLDIQGWGGVFNRERSRVVISPGPHQTYVQTNRTIDIGEDDSFTADGDVAVSIFGPPETEVNEDGTSTPLDTAIADTQWGKEELVVNGDMTWRFHEKKINMTAGGVNRIWLGGITRFIGMEGIICAGAHSRILAGAAVTMAGLASGDVYGGCARSAGVRLYLAGLGYRSMDVGEWMTASYIRQGNTTLVPAVGSTSPNMVKSSMASKAARIAAGVLPFVDILGGLAGLAMMPLMLLLALVNKLRGKPPKPVAAAPRVFNRTVGGSTVVRNSQLVT